MSIKSLIQSLILLLIVIIFAGVYFKYFDTKKNLVDELTLSNETNQEKLEELEKKISDLEQKNKQLNQKIKNDKAASNNILVKEEKKEIDVIKENTISKENNLNAKKSDDKIKIEEDAIETKSKKINEKEKPKKKEIKNLVKDVEYTSVDQKGNKFYLLATSGKSNINNSNILDLENVRGKITSDTRDTIYIVSDFAQYHSINLNSKFYENVVINYQDKQINCINFDINMETNKAIAYNEVIITDPKSTIKAGMVEFDLKTKNIDIKPESAIENIEVLRF